MLREVVKIDEELCDGCGECVPNCHEGALQIIDGKARLISELMCDGLGACIGHCPQNAITIEKREAEDYNEIAVISQMIEKGKATVFAHLKHLQDHNETGYLSQALQYIKANRDMMPFAINEVHELLHGKQDHGHHGAQASKGCPGSAASSFKTAVLEVNHPSREVPSALSQWPVQLHLINPAAGYFRDADLLIAADCAAFAYGNFHQKFLTGRKLVIACPKLDQGKEIYMQKIIRLVDDANIKSMNVVIMEVPCCGGLLGMVQNALSYSKRIVPVMVTVVGIQGEILSENQL
jgi:NAD-dependent dihydropyrimidine dehydrogenase PreA subunit